MKVRMLRQRLPVPFIGVVFAPALSVTALSWSNGYSLLTATAVGTATVAIGLWAVATEP